ncbi:MAG: LytTR family DNA-binding domain-containing protein [Clostridia bacterium]|nr:LytTR family DNA-binding domain-containing protein [Clostridia bacterium]
MKIAIVTDDVEQSDRLKEYVKRYFQNIGGEINVVCFTDGIDIVSDYSADYDIIILDMDSKHMSGFKTAEMIREKDKNVSLVLMSAKIDDAVAGYTVSASGFVPVPVDREQFVASLDRCVKRIKAENSRYILFSTENGMDRVPIDSIVYIESQDHKKVVNTTDELYCLYGTMDSIECRLPSESFSRCNNSFIVNLAHVNGVHGEFVVVGNREIKITRSRRKSFLQAVETFFGKAGL